MRHTKSLLVFTLINIGLCLLALTALAPGATESILLGLVLIAEEVASGWPLREAALGAVTLMGIACRRRFGF